MALDLISVTDPVYGSMLKKDWLPRSPVSAIAVARSFNLGCQHRIARFALNLQKI
jgi:hypothetical protein